MSRIYIDDQDLSKVVYTGTWIKGGSTHEYDQTVASSTNVGDYFTVTFKGNSIAVYGTIDATSAGVVTSYSIDGGSPVQVTSQAGSGDTFQQQFWKSDILTLSEHKLVVTMSKVNPDPEPGEGTIWFDYFLATDPTITSTALLPTNTNLNSSSVIKNDDQKAPVGAIVGGVLGGLFLIFVAIFILIYYCRRKQYPPQRSFYSKTEYGQSHSSVPRHSSVQPFVLGMREASGDMPASRNTAPPGSAGFNPDLLIASRKSMRRPYTITTLPTIAIDTVDGHPPHSDEPLDGSSPVHPVAGANNHAPGDARHKRNAQVALSLHNPSLSNASEPRQHIDSGVRAPDAQMLVVPPEPIELPPVYSPV